MSNLPDFTKLSLKRDPAGRFGRLAERGQDWRKTKRMLPAPACGHDAWEALTSNRLYHGPRPSRPALYSTATPASRRYIRGPYSTMYVNKPWTVRQYAGFSTAEASNALYRREPEGRSKRPVGGFSTSPPTAVTTATTRACLATSAWQASPSTRSRTCTSLRRYPARPHVGLHDHERRGAADYGAVRGRRRGAGCQLR